jgi:2-amino-4-hydroxy-6-hydroxymethyldihydropteridine diphosphokinase
VSRAFVGLGANLDDPGRHVRTAFEDLDRLPGSRVVARSSLYRSAPVGPPGQPHYINAVAELETALEPEALLDALQSIEAAHGRVRAERWGPRTLDLDLLLYGGREIRTPRLSVPHPEMARRNFVLAPLLEIAPHVEIPGLGPAAPIQSRLGSAGLERLSEDA